MVTGLAVVFSAFLMLNLLYVRPSHLAFALASEAFMVGALLSVRIGLNQAWIPAHSANAVGSAVYCLVVAHAAVRLPFETALFATYTMYVGLAIIAVGFFVLSRRWLTVITVGTLTVWGAILWVTPLADDWVAALPPDSSSAARVRLLVVLAAAATFSVVIREVRVRSLERLQDALEDSEEGARQLARAEEVQSVLMNISQAVWTSHGLADLMGTVHLELGKLIDTTNFFLALYHPETDQYSFPYHVDEFDTAESYPTAKPPKSYTDYVRRTGKPLLADDAVHRQLAERGEVERVGTDSRMWLGAPLLSDGEVIGVLAVQTYSDETTYSPRHLEVLTFVSEHVGMAIERQQAQDALRDSETRYRTVVEEQTEFVVRWLPDGTRTFVNESYCRFFDTPREELIGSSFMPFVRADERDRIRDKIASLTPESPIAVDEHRVLLPDGNIGWQQWADRAFFDENGCMTELQSVGRDVTERKEAERALRMTQFAVDHAPDAIAWTTAEGNALYTNEAATELFGYSSTEMQSLTFADIDAERTPEQIADVLKEVVHRGSATFEATVRTKDGRLVPLELAASHAEFDDESALVFVGRDVSARREREEALRESEERFKLLFEFAPDAYFLRDIGGHIVDGNRAVETLTGYSLEELKGKTLNEVGLLSDGQASRAGRALALSALGEEPEPQELVFQHKDGALVTVELRGFPVRFRDQHFVLGIARDVTDRKRAEEALRANERRLFEFLEKIPAGIFILDAKSRTAYYANQRAKELLGEELDALVDSQAEVAELPSICPAFVAGTDEVYPVERLPFMRAMAGEEVTVDDMEIRRGDHALQLHVTASPIFDAVDGEVEYAVTVFFDLTELKEAQRQLRQAQKMEAVGQLAGGVAHDFNNLLTGVTGYTQLALGKDPESPQAPDLRMVLEMSARCTRLTRQLLAFSRTQPLETKVFNLNTLVEGTAKMLKRLIGEHIDTQFVGAPDLANVRADEGEIEQVLLNLAINARDAMPDGGTLTIETANAELGEEYCARHSELEPGTYVLLAMTDSGCGMDAKTSKQIFEPFFTTKAIGKGTGLGLATVYGIVKQHGGHVAVYSEPDRGTAFKVYLPQVSAQVDEAEVEDVSTPNDRGTETILIVEDEVAVREVASRGLNAAGYQTLVADHPDAAERIFHEHAGQIDLLVTDVVMPGMDGPGLYRRLCAGRSPMKVVYMSGYPGKGIGRMRALDPGAPFLQKPFSPTQLVRMVRTALDEPADC